jgi:hypothetical protein
MADPPDEAPRSDKPRRDEEEDRKDRASVSPGPDGPVAGPAADGTQPPAHASSPAEQPAPLAPSPRSFPFELGAIVIALLLVVFAAGIGLTIGSRARPVSTPRTPTETVVALATPTAAVDPSVMEARAFAQPLVAGCSSGNVVWLFSDGGAAVRFDGSRWSIPDPTLRSMLAAACRPGSALVVGRNGGLLTVDEDRREVRVDRFGSEDLAAVALLPDGALAVGDAGLVLRQSVLDWTPVGGQITEDLRGVAVAGRAIRVVGSAGASYRLEAGAWVPEPTHTEVTLRAIAMPAADLAIAAGDRGTLLRFSGGAWARLASGTDVPLRAAVAVGTATWVVGDGGTVLEVIGERVRRVDLGTACTLRAVFAQDAQVWNVGSDGIRGAAWRISPSGTTRWGSC